MGRHSKIHDDTTTVDVIPLVEKPMDSTQLPQQLVDKVNHHFTPMFKGMDHTDQISAQPDIDGDIKLTDSEMLKWRKRFVFALWALVALGCVLGTLSLAMWLVDYGHGCPAPRGVFPSKP